MTKKDIIRKELKFANFEYNEDEKTILIETRSTEEPVMGYGETEEEYAKRVDEHILPITGRIHLNKVYSFALLRFVIRIAQHNWFRKLKKAPIKSVIEEENTESMSENDDGSIKITSTVSYDACPCCSNELTMGCCIGCGEVYDPSP